jgi:hypothetical protein
MSKPVKTQELLDELASRPLEPWVAEVIRQYNRTGTVRWRDLRRLLGSQAENEALQEAVLKTLREAKKKRPPRASAGEPEDVPGLTPDTGLAEQGLNP